VIIRDSRLRLLGGDQIVTECRNLRRRNRLNRQLESAEIVALSSECDEANDHERRKAPRATTTDRILLRSRSDSTAAASPSYIVRAGVFPAHSRGRYVCPSPMIIRQHAYSF